jgi:hypothetical protein
LPDDHPLFGVGPVVSGRFINEGLAKPDDPIYSIGPVVNGRPILKPPKKKPTKND